MRIVFWQNILSPHQLPYIVQLSDIQGGGNEIVIVAYEAISDDRKRMGWDVLEIEGLSKCKVYINPHEVLKESLFATNPHNTIHLFSGIRGFSFVFKALKQSLRYSVKRGVITEMPLTYAHERINGRPLWLHSLRFFLQDLKYAKHIDYCFAMGKKATKYFKSVYRGWKVIPFAYCTEQSGRTDAERPQGKARVVFVGSLSHRKAVDILIKAFLPLNKEMDLTIVGDGSQYESLKTLTNDASSIRFVGTKSQEEIRSILQQHDVLVLPSRHDGWGAVVNEAISEGLYVIVSDGCGAADLCQDLRIGRVFKNQDIAHLTALLSEADTNIETIRDYRTYRQHWAKENISGAALALRMIEELSQ